MNRLATILCVFGLMVGIVFADDRPPATQPVATPRVNPSPKTPDPRDARMAWWREAKFGLFIHWGVYSQAGGGVERDDQPRRMAAIHR